MLKNFINAIKDKKNSSEHKNNIQSNEIQLTGCQGAAKAYVAAGLFREIYHNSSILAIFPEHKDAMRFMEDLRFFMPDRHNDILYFPGYHIQAYKSLSYHGKTAATRMSILYRFLELSRHCFVITTVETLLHKTLPKNILSRSADLVISGDDIDRDLLIAKLNSGGYMRTSLVEEPGDYAVRGGILDIFSPNYDNPVRIELFGDFVESLRHFSPVSQRGIDEIEEAVIIPPGEMIVEKSALIPLLGRLRKAGNTSGLDGLEINSYVEKVREEGKFPGMESMLSIVYPELDSLLDYLPEDTVFLMDRPEEIKLKAVHCFEKSVENYETAIREQRLCVGADTLYMQWDDAAEKIEPQTTVAFRDLLIGTQNDNVFHLGFQDNADISLQLRRGGRYGKIHGNHKNLLDPHNNLSEPIENILDPHNNLSEPGENILEPHENILEPRESVLEPRESVLEPRESVLEPRESILEPRESVLEPRESVLEPRESVLEPRESLLEPLARWFMEKKASGMAAVAVCTSSTQAGRLSSLLRPYGIEPALYADSNFNNSLKFDNNVYFDNSVKPNNSIKLKTLPAPGIYYMLGNLSSGFESLENGLALITDQEIFGAGKRVTSRGAKGARRAKNRFITPEELKEGDIVVHLEHGLGRYEGLRTIALDGIAGDFILISYRDDDRLYLPVDRMEMVEKYVGVDGYSPLLDKIGGKTWSKARVKARKEVEKMAGALLKLYAERRVRKGHAFSPCDSLYDEFQASFPHDETSDQLKAIEEILTDMEDETPMDRLVCGDVGYGKTEVGIRAAFKALNDGKQVAVVVPTTILAEQHLHTFRERFRRWPVKIEALSRFRSRKEQNRILKGMADGRVDLVIGTHRLLQKDISFKSLGLLIIDEEQRFGVKHKEVLKKKRSNIDVLALTATPIPRTLHMSLTGMRDISVIATPPEDRQAIISYVSQYDDAIAADAVKKELARGGQIFFIHNDIATITDIAEKMQKLVPKLRLNVAHGRLPESALEKVMIQFINREIDMLVCTTIVESGLDIPSANTMIINKADRFGLSQIYQLRGRIGRGDEQAYAYLFVPDEDRLTRDARKRLAALMEHRDLGSGFQIAMKDLQIRGSGSALGASQSGHIAAVGYDMFLKLLDEAIADLKGNPVVPSLEPEINVTMSAHIPEDYVQSIEQRLTIYRRLSQMTELSQITSMQKELLDRFGKLPEEGGNMLLKIMLRVLGVKAGVKKMDITPTTIHLVFSELHQKRSLKITDKFFLGSGQGNKGNKSNNRWGYEYTAENAMKINLWPRNKKISRALLETKIILKEITILVNG